MSDSKVIDDLIVLGRAAPEPIQDGRETVCLGGYSPSEGYVRLYPTKRRMTELSRWNVVRVPVERDESHDNRDESYKIAGSKKDWDSLHEKIEKVGELDKAERMRLTDDLAGDCTKRLNENRVSLGIVEPAELLDAYLKDIDDDEDDDTVQLTLQGGPKTSPRGKNDYDKKLYLKYRCEGCVQKTPHDQSTIEWGIYRYWDKNDNFEGVIDALRLNDDSWKHYFFVGNLNNHRTSYVVISVLRFKRDEMIENGIRVGGQSGLNQFD